ncbi:Na(+)/H(+) antiporter NhaA [Trichinella pseudospiralis]
MGREACNSSFGSAKIGELFVVSKKYAATLNGAVGARKQQRLKNTLIFNETQSESPLETGKEWEEKRAIQVLVQRKDPKEERYIVP